MTRHAIITIHDAAAVRMAEVFASPMDVRYTDAQGRGYLLYPLLDRYIADEDFCDLDGSPLISIRTFADAQEARTWLIGQGAIHVPPEFWKVQ